MLEIHCVLPKKKRIMPMIFLAERLKSVDKEGIIKKRGRYNQGDKGEISNIHYV